MGYITNNSRTASKLYKAVFVMAVMIGSVSRMDAVWEIADTLNGLMAVPNLIAILILSEVVIKTTRDELKKL